MSFISHHLPLSEKWFSKLATDYLNQLPIISHLYTYPANINGFKNILSDIQSKNYNRNILAEILLIQANQVNNTSHETTHNIQLLQQDNTYTITTGHQLCLFTGPLYFIYKITAAIQLTLQLKEIFPEYHFVPVFWMATEDHDAEEINHFYFSDKKFLWDISTDGTPVGNLNTQSIQPLLEEIKNNHLLSETDIDFFTRAYLNHHTLADATRYIVNHLFGDKGIVIIDASDKALKKIFAENFYQDIFEQSIFYQTQSTIQFLSDNHYHIQAKPAPINTFFIQNNKRFLIQKENNTFRLKGTNQFFSNDELQSYLNTNPEYFSPNVLLRPLYQQKILPNIAYIGGAAEIAYWLILKPAFDAQNILYPILIQRPSLFIVPPSIEKKIKKLNITYEDIFNNTSNQLIQKIMELQQLNVHLDEQKQSVQNIFNELLLQTQSIDPSLIPFVNAELTKTIKAIDTLEHKLNKSIRQKNETLTKQINDIYHALFPNNIMQDRIWNITYASQLLNFNNIKHFTDNIIPYCSISLSQYKPITILTKN